MMDEDGEFYRLWFEGVNRFLDTAGEASLSQFLGETARSCSESRPLGVYRRAFAHGRSVAEALEELRNSFEDFSYELHEDRVDVFYGRCGCPLALSGRIASPRLCACSASSLAINWEAVLGPGSVRVETVSTVLGGGGRCHFRIHFRRP